MPKVKVEIRCQICIRFEKFFRNLILHALKYPQLMQSVKKHALLPKKFNGQDEEKVQNIGNFRRRSFAEVACAVHYNAIYKVLCALDCIQHKNQYTYVYNSNFGSASDNAWRSGRPCGFAFAVSIRGLTFLAFCCAVALSTFFVPC